MVSLSCVVDVVRKQTEVTCSFDRLDNPCLLLTVGARASSGVDLADRVEETSQNIKALVVNFLRLQLGCKFFAIGSAYADDKCS